MSQDRHCNLTLSRAEWEQFITALGRCREPQCGKACVAIAGALRDSYADEISMDRSVDTWLAVHNPAFSRAKPAEMAMFNRMICQLSAAQFTQVW